MAQFRSDNGADPCQFQIESLLEGSGGFLHKAGKVMEGNMKGISFLCGLGNKITSSGQHFPNGTYLGGYMLDAVGAVRGLGLFFSVK